MQVQPVFSEPQTRPTGSVQPFGKPEPLSEPEVQAGNKQVRAQKDLFKVFFSLSPLNFDVSYQSKPNTMQVVNIFKYLTHQYLAGSTGSGVGLPILTIFANLNPNLRFRSSSNRTAASLLPLPADLHRNSYIPTSIRIIEPVCRKIGYFCVDGAQAEGYNGDLSTKLKLRYIRS